MLLFETSIKVESHVSKKNNRPIYGRGSRKFIGKSDKLLVAEKYLTQMLYLEKLRQKLDTIMGDIHCEMHFIFSKENSRSYKLCDLSNLYELPQDCLQESGIIENDRFIQSHDGSRKYLGEENILKIRIFKYTK